MLSAALFTRRSVSRGSSVIGTISGFLRGPVDYAIQRVVDAVMAIPGLILLLAVVSVLGQSLMNVVLALCIYVTPRTVRIVRGEVLIARQFDYVLSDQGNR